MSRPISVDRLKNRIDKNEKDIKDIKEKNRKRKNVPEIKNGKYNYDLRKAIRTPNSK